MNARTFLLFVIAAAMAGCTDQRAEQGAAVLTTPTASSAPSASAPATPPAARPLPADVCGLLARGTVESIFGVLRGDARSDIGLRGEKQCRYQNLTGQWLTESVYGADRWELEKGIVSELHPATIAGIGDEAFSVKQGTDHVAYVRRGDGVLEVRCSCDAATVQSIAKLAATQL